MTDRPRVGWTKAEYDACPELANRLHRHILDVCDERDRYRTALEHIVREADRTPMEDGLDAGGIARKALRDV